MSSKRIALYGGTFDPIHRGHLDTLRMAIDPMGWHRVILIPARLQPFKIAGGAASPLDRYAMAVLATMDDRRFVVSKRELERDAVSWSIDTIRAFASRHPDMQLEWVIGDDNLPGLPKWKDLDGILSLVNFVVLERSGGVRAPDTLVDRVCPPSIRAKSGCIVFAGNPVVEVSGTEIRRRVAAGEDVAGLVGREVAEYIVRYGLYRAEEET
jgi:nicotinate-nucleotide adenylyltransferase